MPTKFENYGNPINQNNYIFNFIQKQKKLMKQGYTETKAFEIVNFWVRPKKNSKTKWTKK